MFIPLILLYIKELISLLITASVGSMFTFLFYDFMNKQILWLLLCYYS